MTNPTERPFSPPPILLTPQMTPTPFQEDSIPELEVGGTKLEESAIDCGCEMLWSIPRKTALSAYTKFGFETVGDFFKTETSDANIYVRKFIL